MADDHASYDQDIECELDGEILFAAKEMERLEKLIALQQKPAEIASPEKTILSITDQCIYPRPASADETGAPGCSDYPIANGPSKANRRSLTQTVT